MTHVYNDAPQFKDDVLHGFALAHGAHVDRVPDASGFVRAGGPAEGKVSLVVGGGSGHYPSYSGVVGHGFADGAVLGDVFASPSAEQVYRIARAAHGGAGVLLGFGNYAGDRLNFGVAAERLRAEGIDARIVYVTDDVASAGPDDVDDRRGIAGTFTVYKIAGAAAELGWDLDAVEAAMRRANAATYSFGAAFAGCTLPGARDPLFAVADGSMDFGLGIHGEPGVESVPWLPSRELARQLVDRVLAERPAATSGRVAVVLNGLGATKYEELYVLWGDVVPLLEQAGAYLVEPEIGELVTSLDMAGVSLTLTWLDEELEQLWRAPAETPAYRKGAPATSTRFTARRVQAREVAAADVAVVSDQSRRAARVVRDALHALREVVERHADELGRMDAVAGDGDHGIGMTRGARAAAEAADATDGGVQSVLTAAGAAFGDKAGGTSGILWGLLLEHLGRQLGDTAPVTPTAVSDAVTSAAERLRDFGRARLGDKTLLDALFPFAEELAAQVGAGESLAGAWSVAAEQAAMAGQATAGLRPRIGRARPLAERSIGTPDPGAVSFGLIVTAIAPVLAEGRISFHDSGA